MKNQITYIRVQKSLLEPNITMSADSQPIPPAAFASALKSLPLSSVYGKVIELRNSIHHLVRSNDELKEYIRVSSSSAATATATSASAGADTENKELESYVLENERVIESMKRRIELCRAEVEERGQLWLDELDELADGDVHSKLSEMDEPTEVRLNGSNGTGEEIQHESRSQVPNNTSTSASMSRTSAAPPGRQVDVHMDEDDEEGVHL